MRIPSISIISILSQNNEAASLHRANNLNFIRFSPELILRQKRCIHYFEHRVEILSKDF